MNNFTMPVTAADIVRERREGETMMQTKTRLQRDGKRRYLQQPWMPDFDSVRDKRMSELTPEQQRDTHELWLREQMDHMAPYYQEHLLFLLERLDEVRLTRPAEHVPEGWQLVPAAPSTGWASELMKVHPIRHDAAVRGIRDTLATAPKYQGQK